MKESWSPGEFESEVFESDETSRCAKSFVSGAEGEGAPACADWVEEIEDALIGDFDGHGNLGRIESRKRGADALRAGNHAADPRGYVVGPLVAQDL